jgi:hypothetical protein
MKQILFLSFCFFALSHILFSQTSTAWVRTLDGPAHFWDEASAIAVDDSGNVFVTGIDLIGGFSSRDYMTAKYNSSGILQWVRTMDISSNEYAQKILLDKSGNVIVAGNSEGDGYIIIKYSSAGDSLGTIYCSPSDIDQHPDIAVDDSNNIYLTGSFYDQSVTTKYDSAGVEQWINYYSGPNNITAWTNHIVIDKANNKYVSGTTEIAYSSYAFLLMKYNTNGDTIWVRTLYDSLLNRVYGGAMEVDDSCNVIFTGYRGTSTNRGFVIVKYDSSGVLKWIREPKLPNSTLSLGVGIAVDRSENIYITGTSTKGSYSDIFTTKFSPNGDSLWTTIFNGSANNNDYVEAMVIDNSANVYITGMTVENNPGLNFNCLTIMYDSSGVQQAVQKFNGNANDEDAGFAIALDKWNNVYVAGRTVDSVNSFDYLVIKYGENLVNVKDSPSQIPVGYKLYQNYPNPFNPTTTISYQLPTQNHVTLKVFDVLGRGLTTLVNGVEEAGYKSVNFDASTLPSGVYFYRLDAGTFVETKKLILIK